MRTRITFLAGALCLALFVSSVSLASAQVITTPYWCGSFWSSQPCYSTTYGYSYYSYPYQYQYQNYYPTNYYSYAPYQQRPTCVITYTYTYGNTYKYGYQCYNQQNWYAPQYNYNYYSYPGYQNPYYHW